MTDRNQMTLPATCNLHGIAGFTNLRVRLRPRGLEIDPHVTGACVLTLSLVDAAVLHSRLAEWL
jgi:hypothetical protein